MYEIIGYRKNAFTFDGNVFNGWTVSFCIPMSKQIQGENGKDFEGVDVFSFFINSSKFPDFIPKLNDCYELYFSYFNGKRKISGMHKV